MIQIREVKKGDFQSIYPLLKRFNNQRLSEASWQNLFQIRFKGARDTIGLAACEGEKPVGFMATIYSRRGDNELCNISSWIVDEKYKGAGLNLLAHLLKEKGVTYTSFTANSESYPILKRFGFDDFDTSYYLVPFFKGMLTKRAVKIIWDADIILPLLDEKNKTLFLEHQPFGGHALMKAGAKACLFLSTTVKKRGMRFVHIHYVSDKDFFGLNIGRATHKICRRFRASGLIVYKELLGSDKPAGSFSIDSPARGAVKSRAFKAKEIDSLYSELFILP